MRPNKLFLFLCSVIAVSAARIDINAMTHPDGTFSIAPGQTAYFGIADTLLQDERVRFSFYGLAATNDMPEMLVTIGEDTLTTYTGTGQMTTAVNGAAMRWDIIYLDAMTGFTTGVIDSEVSVTNMGVTAFTVGIAGRLLYEPLAINYKTPDGSSWGTRPTYIQMSVLSGDDPGATAPEPATFAVVGAALAGVYFTRRSMYKQPAPSRFSPLVRSARTT